MPRFKKALVLALAKNLQVFLKLDIGIGRIADDVSTEPPKMGAGGQTEVQAGKRGEEVLDSGSRAAVADPGRGAHSLPEPDESVNRRQIFHSLVSSLKPGRMLDLAAGPGNFSIPAAQLGWEVTAVDVRSVRRPDPEAERDPERARLVRSIDWVDSDVREFQIEAGEYDLICVFGILHHLELEDQISLVKKCAGTLTILDCRVAPEVRLTEGRYEGHYVREPGKSREERDEIPGASWGNETSFRHTEESLIRLLHDSGFQKVTCMRPPHALNYTFYVALPVE